MARQKSTSTVTENSSKRYRVRPDRNGPAKSKREPVLRKAANVEDEATGNAFEIYSFRKPVGRRGKAQFPRERASDPIKLRDLLISKNWLAPRRGDKQDVVVKRAIAEMPTEHWLHSAHVGWRRNRRGFVLHNTVIGAAKRKLILKPPAWLNHHQHVTLARKGDLETWIAQIGRPSRFSTRMMLMISAAFAAPLIQIAGLQPFAILLYGRSKTGKTTALLAAASVIGIGRESELPNFNTTDSAFLEKARLFNDLILPGNEIGLVKGPKKAIYPRVRGLLYAFAEGRDVARHSASSYAPVASSATWRGIFLPNSEHSFDALAEMAGETRDPGEYARCTDVPATRKGVSTVFDRCPTRVTPEAFPAWSRKELISIRKACEQNHGVPIASYLRYLLGRGAAIEKAVQDYMAEFESALAFESEDGALHHAARNFALVYAGGRLAIDAKILPWDPDRLRAGLASCFKAAMRAMDRHETIATRARRILLKKVRSSNLPLRNRNGINPAEHDGFREKLNGQIRYTIKSVAMRSWFPDVAQFRAALEYLDSQGVLTKNASIKPSSGRTEWAVTTPRWGSKRKVKSVRFRLASADA